MAILNWSAAIQHCQQSGSGYVIATIINTQGSTPRDGGSKMVITTDATYDTIGGGQLEFLLVQQARELLAQNKTCQILKPIPLAAEAAQCCGGNVTVMLEAFAACSWQIALFGAGHVCQSLVTILAGLPCQVCQRIAATNFMAIPPRLSRNYLMMPGSLFLPTITRWIFRSAKHCCPINAGLTPA
jgi:xanthine dehydrogenase accessory factor